jgi:hypothetical protein
VRWAQQTILIVVRHNNYPSLRPGLPRGEMKLTTACSPVARITLITRIRTGFGRSGRARPPAHAESLFLTDGNPLSSGIRGAPARQAKRTKGSLSPEVNGVFSVFVSFCLRTHPRHPRFNDFQTSRVTSRRLLRCLKSGKIQRASWEFFFLLAGQGWRPRFAGSYAPLGCSITALM